MAQTFTIVYDSVLYDENLNVSDALIYSRLQSMTSVGESVVRVKNSWLGEKLNMSEQKVSKSINKLVKYKYLKTTIKRSSNNGIVKTIREIEVIKKNETIIQNNVEHKQEVDVYKVDKQTEEVNVMQMFNMKFETNYKSIPGNLKNLCIEYKIEDFAKVINNAFEDQFWKDKATPSSIFKVDNFERLLNQKPKQKEITIADLDIDYSDF